MHVSELFTAESKSQVYGQLHDLLQTESAIATTLKCVHTCTCGSKFIIKIFITLFSFFCTWTWRICLYDDGCHLRKFAQNPCRKDATPTATVISGLNIVVDKLHMKGHVDPWCKANSDAKSFTDLDNVRWKVNKIQD